MTKPFTVYYSDSYVAASHEFDTTRKAKHVADALRPSVACGALDLAAPYVDYDVTAIHDPEYVKAVLLGAPDHLAESQGFPWDSELPVMVQAHTNGLVSAVHDVWFGTQSRGGSLSSGLHHAARRYGGGFCTFNGLAAAAAQAFDLGYERVLSLDFDAHCGGGTYDIMHHDPRWTQIDVSVSAFDAYQPDRRHRLVVTDAANYMTEIAAALEVVRAEPWDLIIYNAGMDPINCGVDQRTLHLREMLVSEIIGGTDAIFALAGGYTWGGVTMDELVELHTATIYEWAAYGTGGVWVEPPAAVS